MLRGTSALSAGSSSASGAGEDVSEPGSDACGVAIAETIYALRIRLASHRRWDEVGAVARGSGAERVDVKRSLSRGKKRGKRNLCQWFWRVLSIVRDMLCAHHGGSIVLEISFGVTNISVVTKSLLYERQTLF